ncbi:MAG: ATPase, T2SS/T4P/T4SS family [Thermoleophilia bacterium]|nr:ATPase, T2SS/T4P/T4SS family [Thermoleophilia bacterium]
MTTRRGGQPDHALVERLRARAAERIAGAFVDGEELRRQIDDVIDEDRVFLSEDARAVTLQAVVDEALGLGPIEHLLRDPSVTEIAVNGPRRVFVEREGQMQSTEVTFADDEHVMHVIDRVLSPLGRRVDVASPMVDARLADGSRLNVVVPPLALDGPSLAIRRFPEQPLTAEDLLRNGTVDEELRALLETAVTDHQNLLVTGGTGSGKTTTLAVLASFIEPHERLITIEDAAELRIELPHVVRLESRPPSLQGTGAVTIRDLVRNALRMRPDRIVVGEVRGHEALDMLAAMTTGHEGSISTIHASSPEDALRRLQLLAAMGDSEIAYDAIVDQVASAIDLVVHQVRLADGRRRISSVAAVHRGADRRPELVELARWIPGADRFETRGLP